MKRISTSFRMTVQASALLKALSARFGVSRSAILELAIREKARREGVKFKTEESRA